MRSNTKSIRIDGVDYVQVKTLKNNDSGPTTLACHFLHEVLAGSKTLTNVTNETQEEFIKAIKDGLVDAKKIKYFNKENDANGKKQEALTLLIKNILNTQQYNDFLNYIKKTSKKPDYLAAWLFILSCILRKFGYQQLVKASEEPGETFFIEGDSEEHSIQNTEMTDEVKIMNDPGKSVTSEFLQYAMKPFGFAVKILDKDTKPSATSSNDVMPTMTVKIKDDNHYDLLVPASQKETGLLKQISNLEFITAKPNNDNSRQSEQNATLTGSVKRQETPLTFKKNKAYLMKEKEKIDKALEEFDDKWYCKQKEKNYLKYESNESNLDEEVKAFSITRETNENLTSDIANAETFDQTTLKAMVQSFKVLHPDGNFEVKAHPPEMLKQMKLICEEIFSKKIYSSIEFVGRKKNQMKLTH